MEANKLSLSVRELSQSEVKPPRLAKPLALPLIDTPGNFDAHKENMKMD